MPEAADFIERIKNAYTREELPPKTLLIKEGAAAKKLFFIDQGCCRCWFNNDGVEVTFQFLFEGSFASSFESMTSGAASWYSIETLEPAVVYSVPMERFRDAQENNPLAKASYVQYIEQRLMYMHKLFVAHIKDSPEQRYKELLAHHPEIIQRIPQHYIASFLGITSVSLSRIRNRK
ncbi:Crp/Fnr family transcriptional regulator [Mucilaginibacter corticis]|uniref:Crp/Fnr family transcriptional regulator n=1 Tax=Mucilaginibacter corticis TaxID=2597670 RepID=A0A556MLT7_9SPHI|nr:Crp/Fnr family transcriptional regulator [Mucilaginibacter corticis]TSJ40894.1 Crp/Fnr family transcriptional regulator [Mucilaginibacter corticis]